MKRKVTRPEPTGREIKIDKRDMMVSKTDTKGVISYANNAFIRVSGYSKEELIDSPHNILRHPDMPAAIFYLMWKNIKEGKNITAVVKNLAKNGSHYWVITDFDIKWDNAGRVKTYIAFRQSAGKKIVKKIQPVYKKLLEIEKEKGIDASTGYLQNMLQEKGITYNEFIEELANENGLNRIMKTVKKIFS